MHRRKFITIGLAALAGCTGSNTTETTEQTTQTPDGPPMHDIGDPFTVGTGAKSVRYRVTDAISIDGPIGSSMVNTSPDGIFVVVVVEMENVGDESLDITTRHLKLMDVEGRTFDADTEALTHATNDARIEAESITFDQLQPGLTATRSIIFDVPTGQGYGLLVEPVGVLSNAGEHVVPVGSV